MRTIRLKRVLGWAIIALFVIGFLGAMWLSLGTMVFFVTCGAILTIAGVFGLVIWLLISD
jgi:hypothetical protein